MAGFMREKISDIIRECQTRSIPGLESFTSKPNEVVIEDDPLFIDGYSSVIVRVRAGDGSTVIAKHAPPYVRMVDLEMVRLGRGSMEVGLLFSDMIVTYYYHLASTEDADSHRQIAHEIKDCTYHLVKTYIEHMSWRIGENAHHVAKLLKELAASVGCAIFILMCLGVRKCLGTSQIQMLEAGIRLMEQHHTADSVDKIYSILALE